MSSMLQPYAGRAEMQKSIHELTGKQLLDKDSVPDDIAPLQITPQGNYGIAIAWDDGHDDAIYIRTNK